MSAGVDRPQGRAWLTRLYTCGCLSPPSASYLCAAPGCLPYFHEHRLELDHPCIDCAEAPAIQPIALKRRPA